ncbi:polysaccharide pyruvyl transferase family protein [Priestia aryabhattai]|uniref:polysaccharide pyruvyl transferase family protein n=1 Tax=Priestia TaxID=2800373 RepID=UPI0003A2812D|nr:polysaccharide pyruvyl transferase family protein [Priestia megaterium]QFY72038.1 polysaccharide pyruvyl transferase family protein [Priestia megaterium]
MTLGTNFLSVVDIGSEITLVGYYGMDNFGDDLMLKSLLDEFEKHDLKVNILAYREVSWLSTEAYPNVKVWIWPDSKLGKFQLFKKASQNSKAVFWGGGTCFTDEDGDGYFKYMLYAKLLGKKVGYLGVGIGNLSKTSRLFKTKKLINISSILTFRDKTSLKKASNWKKKSSKASIELVEDPANQTLEVLASSLPVKTNNNSLVLAWRDLSDYSNTTIGAELLPVSEMAIKLCEDHEMNRIVIMDTDSVRDKELSISLKESIEKLNSNISVEYNDCTNYEEKLAVINESKVVFTSRLHVAVAAKYLNKECFVYNYSPKISYFVQEEGNNKIQLIDKDLTIKSA